MATPVRDRSSSAWRRIAEAPTSTPQVGCATIITSGFSMISRPTMNFCRLPPDSARALVDASPPRTSKRLTHSSA